MGFYNKKCKKNINGNENFKKIFNTWVFLKLGCSNNRL